MLDRKHLHSIYKTNNNVGKYLLGKNLCACVFKCLTNLLHMNFILHSII